MPYFDLDSTLASAHDWLGLMAYKFNRANGFLDRIDAVIEAGEIAADESRMVLHLLSDARTLRKLADALDERREALTGRARRLRLVAAE
jgi:hypothetical protein